MAFKPDDHFIKLPKRVKDPDSQGWITVQQDYLEVKYRLVWFREKYPHGIIRTEEILVDLDQDITIEVDGPWDRQTNKKSKVLKTAKGYARFKATVEDGEGGIATGYGTESAVEFGDFVEKAETRAIGRALAALGIGTQFAGDEMSEGDHVADSPVSPPEPDLPHDRQGVPILHAADAPARPRATNGAASTPASASRSSTPRSAPRPSAVKAAAQANTSRIQEAHEVLGQKPIEKLNHEEAYVACQQRLTILAGGGTDATSQQTRLDYMAAVFGTGISSDVKLYQQGKSALVFGLRKLLDMTPDQPPVEADVPMSIPPEDRPPELPQVERSLGDSTGDKGQGGDRSTESQLDASTVTPPEPPIIEDGYVSAPDVAIIKTYALMMDQLDCYEEMTGSCPTENDYPLITQRLWDRLIAAVQYRASQVQA